MKNLFTWLKIRKSPFLVNIYTQTCKNVPNRQYPVIKIQIFVHNYFSNWIFFSILKSNYFHLNVH